MVVLPDLLYWHVLNGMPLVPAVEAVGAELIAKLPDLRVYLTQPRHYARRVTDEMVWREAKPYRPASLQPRSIARGFIAGHDGPRHKLVPVPEQKAVSRLAGPRDLLVGTFNAWHRAAKDCAALYRWAVHGGMPAILLSDAEELFGYNVALPKLLHPAAQPEQASAAVDLKAEKLARAWQVARGRGADGEWLSTHVDAVNDLRAEGLSDTKIARELGISRARLQQACGTRREAKAAKAAKSPALGAAVQALAR